MEEKKLDPMLEKVEPNRRDFIKKVAVGTAYAVPVIASFSLDSVRNKAFAQATYTTPTPPAALVPPKVALLSALRSGQGVRVTFDQPMDTSIAANDRIFDRRTGPVCGDDGYDRTVSFLCAADAVTTNGCDPGVPYSWSWESATAQLLTISGGFFCVEVRIEYGYGSEGCIDFRGTNGLKLEPFSSKIEITCEDV